jgi:hypothetical protein
MTTPKDCNAGYYESCTCFQTVTKDQTSYTSCNSCLNAKKGYYWVEDKCVEHTRYALPEYMTCTECLTNGYDWGMECIKGTPPEGQTSSCQCTTSSPTLYGYSCVYTSNSGQYESGEVCLSNTSNPVCYVYCSKNKLVCP